MPLYRLQQKEKYEAILNDAMKYAMEFEHPNDEIQGFISYIGREINCDRCYIYENNDEGTCISNTYEWCPDHVLPIKSTRQKLEKKHMPAWFIQFEAQTAIISKSTEELKHIDGHTYEYMKTLGIDSIILCPLKRANTINGFFGVDNSDIEQADNIKALLSMMSTFIIAMLRRRNTFFNAQHEATMRTYGALSQIYLTMHRINIQEDTFQIIKTHPVVENNRGITTLSDCQKQIWAVADAVVTADFLEEFKKFVDFSTLDERMKDLRILEFEFIGKTEGWCREQLILINRDDNGRIEHIIMTTEVIDEVKKRENHLRYLAQTDMLTGLKNRGSGEQSICRRLEQGRIGCLALMDCDHFKSINDTFGHIAGDKVLIAIGEAMLRGIQPGDVAMRLGGDEFAIYIVNVQDEEAARRHIDKIYQEIDKISIPELQGRPIHLSMGATFFRSSSPANFDGLYGQADKALYKSKKQPESYVTFYDNM